MKLILALILFSGINLILADTITLPGAGFSDGWSKSDAVKKYFKNDLYGHIDGGAELFLEFGFDSLLVQDYANGDREISLEIYCMEQPESALGIYLMKCGKEESAKNVQVRNTANPYQMLAVNDRYYIQVNNFTGDSTAIVVMENLVNLLFKDKTVSAVSDLFKLLPTDQLENGSEKLIRGQYGLLPFYTFGEGDIFNLNGKVFAVTGVYKTEQGEKFSRMIVRYPDINVAENVFKNIKQNLDSYLIIVKESGNELIFRDYQNKFGQIKLSGSRLNIAVHLPENPDLK